MAVKRFSARQPQQFQGIDYANPITRGLVTAYTAGIDHAAKKPARISSGVQPKVNVPGFEGDLFSFGGTDYVDFGNKIGASGPFTYVIWHYQTAAPTDNDTVFSYGDYATFRMKDYTFYTYSSASSWQNTSIGGANLGNGLYRNAMWHDGIGSNTLMGYGPNNVFNSVTTSVAPRLAPSNQTNRLGADSSNGRSNSGSVQIALIFTRVLNNDEMMTLLNNPWQVFKQQRIAGNYALASTSIALAASLTGTGSETANLVQAQPLSAGVSGTGVEAANLGQSVPLAGVVSGTGTEGATLSQAVPLAGAVTGTGVEGANLSVAGSTSVALAANLTGTGAETANLVQAQALAGNVAGTGAESANLSVLKPLAAALAGSGAESAALAQKQALAAGVAGHGAQSGSLSVPGPIAIPLAASLAGTGSIAATLTEKDALSASVTGQSAIAATLTLTGGVTHYIGGDDAPPRKKFKGPSQAAKYAKDQEELRNAVREAAYGKPAKEIEEIVVIQINNIQSMLPMLLGEGLPLQQIEFAIQQLEALLAQLLSEHIARENEWQEMETALIAAVRDSQRYRFWWLREAINS